MYLYISFESLRPYSMSQKLYYVQDSSQLTAMLILTKEIIFFALMKRKIFSYIVPYCFSCYSCLSCRICKCCFPPGAVLVVANGQQCFYLTSQGNQRIIYFLCFALWNDQAITFDDDCAGKPCCHYNHLLPNKNPLW